MPMLTIQKLKYLFIFISTHSIKFLFTKLKLLNEIIDLNYFVFQVKLVQSGKLGQKVPKEMVVSQVLSATKVHQDRLVARDLKVTVDREVFKVLVALLDLPRRLRCLVIMLFVIHKTHSSHRALSTTRFFDLRFFYLRFSKRFSPH